MTMNFVRRGLSVVAVIALTGIAFAGNSPVYLYSDKETITMPYACEVVKHPYFNGERGARDCAPYQEEVIAKVAAGEAFGPLEPGSYLVHETVAPGRVRTRYLGVAAPGWTVLQLTVGSTGDILDSVFHSRRVPVNYYVTLDQVQADTTFLGFERDYGDAIYLHLHPDSLGNLDPKFKTLKANWDDFTVPEIVERLKALDAWMQAFGFEPLHGFASYTPANTLIKAMREVKWNVLHSLCPEQNWSDGHWAINHWGMLNQPFYVAADDFRKAAHRGSVAGAGDVLGMCMNSYNLYMPHVVNWGDNVCSPSHFMRWHRSVETGDEPLRYETFFDDYLKVAASMKDSPYFLTTGYEFGRSFGTRSMTVHNRRGAEYAVDSAKNGGKVVFATGRDVAAWYERFCTSAPENVFTQRDYLAGARIMDKPIDSGPSIGMEMRDYKACFSHLEPIAYYHYDYTIPWHFATADTTAPNDFAMDDAARVAFSREGTKVQISVKESLPRAVPVCLWDARLQEPLAGIRAFTPSVLDDGRLHTVIELPKGWKGTLAFNVVSTGKPDPAEFGGLVTPLWRVQTIGEGPRRRLYAFVDTPLLGECKVELTLPKPCTIDAPEGRLGDFKAGDRVTLTFNTRRTWFRFNGVEAADIQPDKAGVAALEAAANEWKAFSAGAGAALKQIQAQDDAFFRKAIPANETLLLDVDCFGNCAFGEKSRAKAYDRVVYAANDKITALEYSDGGISLGKGKSYWVHPRGLTFQIEGLDSLNLKPTDTVRVRLYDVADANEPLSYKLTVKSGWNKIIGNFVDPSELGLIKANSQASEVIWEPLKVRSVDGIFAFDVPASKLQEGTISVGLRTNQKQVLDDWYAEGGFIARLERILVTKVAADAK